MLDALRQLDHQWLLAINHAHTPALDGVMKFVSNRLVWIPFYAALIGWLIYHFRHRAKVLLPLLIAAIALADSITSRLFKPFFGRLRPCHTPDLASKLSLPDGCGGQFGFMSSHAANSMALATFLLLALPPRRFWAFKLAVFCWAALLSYSRIYLAAHYPSDVLGGAVVGALLGTVAAWLFHRISRPPALAAA